MINEESMEILQRLTAIEIEQKNHNEQDKRDHEEVLRVLNNLTSGLGARVEQAGKDIAVIQSVANNNEKKIESLESSRAYIVMSVIGTFLTSIWAVLLGRKP